MRKTTFYSPLFQQSCLNKLLRSSLGARASHLALEYYEGNEIALQLANVIHDTEERRGFIKLTGISLVYTIGFLVFLLFAIGVVVVLPAVLGGIGLGEVSYLTINLLRRPNLIRCPL